MTTSVSAGVPDVNTRGMKVEATLRAISSRPIANAINFPIIEKRRGIGKRLASYQQDASTCFVSIHEDFYVLLPFMVHKHPTISLRVVPILEVRADALSYGKPDVIWSQVEVMMSRVSHSDGSKQAALELPSFTDHLSLGTVKNFLIVIPLVPSASQSQVIAQAINRYLPFNVRCVVRLSTITLCVLLQSPGFYLRCQKLCAACMRHLLWLCSEIRFSPQAKKTDQIAHSKEPLTIPGRAVGITKIVLHKLERVLGFTY
jgi:hypothetical protein